MAHYLTHEDIERRYHLDTKQLYVYLGRTSY